MEKRIREKLKEVEEANNVRILFAVESGSRAWGFTSPDSDYDLRFVYVQDKSKYLSLWESSDTISFMTEDELDGSGWDLKKAMKLLAKSNASFLGWLFSPVVYLDRDGALDEMKALAMANFSPVAGFYHYYSMNKGFDELLGSEEMTLKSYFYAIRTALCANWILKYGTVPPVEFQGLYSLIESSDQKLLNELIALKATAIEKANEPVHERLIALTKDLVQENQEHRDKVKSRKADLLAFDKVFLNHLK